MWLSTVIYSDQHICSARSFRKVVFMFQDISKHCGKCESGRWKEVTTEEHADTPNINNTFVRTSIGFKIAQPQAAVKDN